MADMGSVSAPLTSDTPAPEPGIKQWWLSSGQGVLNLGKEEEALCDLPKESPHKKQKPLARILREAQQEAFSKDSEVVKVAKQNYHKTHRGMFQQEGPYDLTLSFLGDDPGNKPFECQDI